MVFQEQQLIYMNYFHLKRVEQLQAQHIKMREER